MSRLHALDITTGAEKFGGPVVIQASVSGTGLGTIGGKVSFNPLTNNQRPALLLISNVVYIGFADHGDSVIYHGWVLGYNSTNLQQVMAFCTTPNEWKGRRLAGRRWDCRRRLWKSLLFDRQRGF